MLSGTYITAGGGGSGLGLDDPAIQEVSHPNQSTSTTRFLQQDKRRLSFVHCFPLTPFEFPKTLRDDEEGVFQMMCGWMIYRIFSSFQGL